MPRNPAPTVLDRPCGDTLIRLKDLPLEKRLAALTGAPPAACRSRTRRSIFCTSSDVFACLSRIAA